MKADTVFIEPTFRDEQHAPSNAGLVQIALQTRGDAAIRFYATPKQWSAVKESLPPGSEGLQVTSIVVGPSGDVRLSRFLRQIRNLWFATRGSPSQLVVLSSGPETFFACRLLCWLRPRLQIRVILHGNLVDAVAPRSRDPRRRPFDFISGLRVARHPRIRLVVLEGAIRDAMEQARLPDWERTLVLPHPLNAREFSEAPGLTEPDVIAIGFIGHAKSSKGFGDFLELARQGGGRLRFRLVGFLAEKFPAELLAIVDCPQQPLSRERFVRAVSSLDYACLPFVARQYAFTASGSMLDAVCGLRPIIAVSFPALRDIEQRFGPIGYLCDTFADMQALIVDGSRLSDRTAYLGFQDNLRRLRASRLPANLVPAFEAMFESESRLRSRTFC